MTDGSAADEHCAEACATVRAIARVLQPASCNRSWAPSNRVVGHGHHRAAWGDPRRSSAANPSDDRIDLERWVIPSLLWIQVNSNGECVMTLTIPQVRQTR